MTNHHKFLLALTLAIATPAVWSGRAANGVPGPQAPSFITRIVGGIPQAKGLVDFRTQMLPRLKHGLEYERLLQRHLSDVATAYARDAALRTVLTARLPALAPTLEQAVASNQLPPAVVRDVKEVLGVISLSPYASSGLRNAISQALTWIDADAQDYQLGRMVLVSQPQTTVLLVKVRPGVSPAQMNSLAAAVTAQQREYWAETGWYSFSIPASRVNQVIQFFTGRPEVERVETSGTVHTLEVTPSLNRIPNDPGYAQLWGMRKIQANLAWGERTSAMTVVVAVTDTGKDMNHPDLLLNRWINPREIPGNRIDDDHNGYVDDVGGWDFVSSDNDPNDDNDHGTHVSGTIGAIGNNARGVVGVAWQVRIMPLKFLDSCGSGTIENAIKAILYAANNGAHIINASWGGSGTSQALSDAIAYFGRKGGLLVAAAGNDSANNDTTPAYPASFPLGNIIAVAATDANDVLASFSNWGVTSTDLAAPGVNILSTVIDGYSSSFSGTSMATPHVAGVAALVKAKHPAWGWAQIKPVILSTVDRIPGLTGKVLTGGRLNAYRAILR